MEIQQSRDGERESQAERLGKTARHTPTRTERQPEQERQNTSATQHLYAGEALMSRGIDIRPSAFPSGRLTRCLPPKQSRLGLGVRRLVL
eukprot:2100103-Rhodomonas_salina.1